MSDENNAPTEVEAPSTAEDTQAVSEPEARPSLDNYKDDYDQRIDAILAKHEAEKNNEAPPEPETLREGESWDNLFEKADPQSQRAMQQLRADYTRKTQELAAQRKEMEEQRTQLEAMRMGLEDNAAYKAIQEAAQTDAGEFDPYDTASFERYVNKIVAERLESVLQPMAEQQMKANAQARIQSFMSEHPDLQSDESLKAEVRETLLANDDLRLQDAYWIVKGRRSHSQQERTNMENMAFQRAAKASGLKVGVGQKKGMTLPTGAKSMRAADLYQHLLKQKK